MILCIVSIVSSYLVYSSFCQSVSISLSNESHNEFVWNAFKKVSADYKENFVMSPYSLRRLFSCFRGVLLLTKSTIGSILDQELSDVLKIEPNEQPSGHDHRPYVEQWMRYSNANVSFFEHCRKVNRTAMAVAIGSEKQSHVFESIIQNCVIYTGHLQPSTAQHMGHVVNDVLKNITNSSVQNYLADTDINTDWKFFAIDSWQFDGLWKFKFQEEFSANCNFYANKENKGLTKFLYLEEVLKYGLFPELNVQAVELPYHDQSPLSCLLMMAVDGNFESLIKTMTQVRFEEVVSKLVAAKTTVRMPQFGLKTTVPGRRLLESMGLKMPFNQGVFKVFEQSQEVALGEIIQKLELNMGANGEVSAQRFVDKRQDKQFTANQPFLFVVYDRKELLPILVGQYLKTPPDAAMGYEDSKKCDDPPVGYR
ncbi:serpin B5-like isoform X2 [Armigeres subalbatus]|uniref:serpin B5-like isoform X2 n=1 Tax=Armigeres subalbatus TaxID=124917 RepID=UPI002ED25A03